MKKSLYSFGFVVLLVIALISGCIGGDDNDDNTDDDIVIIEEYEGLLSDLKIEIDSIPDGYELMGEETITDPTEMDDEEGELVELGFEEAYNISYMYLSEDYTDMGVIMQLVIRFDPEKIDEALAIYKDNQIEEFADEITIEEIDDYGNQAFKLMAYEDETGLELQEIVFFEKDLLVAVIVMGDSESAQIAADLASDIDAKI